MEATTFTGAMRVWIMETTPPLTICLGRWAQPAQMKAFGSPEHRLGTHRGNYVQASDGGDPLGAKASLAAGAIPSAR